MVCSQAFHINTESNKIQQGVVSRQTYRYQYEYLLIIPKQYHHINNTDDAPSKASLCIVLQVIDVSQGTESRAARLKNALMLMRKCKRAASANKEKTRDCSSRFASSIAIWNRVSQLWGLRKGRETTHEGIPFFIVFLCAVFNGLSLFFIHSIATKSMSVGEGRELPFNFLFNSLMLRMVVLLDWFIREDAIDLRASFFKLMEISLEYYPLHRAMQK